MILMKVEKRHLEGARRRIPGDCLIAKAAEEHFKTSTVIVGATTVRVNYSQPYIMDSVGCKLRKTFDEGEVTENDLPVTIGLELRE